MTARVSLSVVRDTNNFVVLTANRTFVGYGSQQDCEKFVAYKSTQATFPGAFMQELEHVSVVKTLPMRAIKAVERTYAVVSLKGVELKNKLTYKQACAWGRTLSKQNHECVNIKAEAGSGCLEYVFVIALIAVVIVLIFAWLGNGNAVTGFNAVVNTVNQIFHIKGCGGNLCEGIDWAIQNK